MAKKEKLTVNNDQAIMSAVPEVKIRKSTTFYFVESDIEPGGGPSETIPDQSMSMREIYERFASGRQITAYSPEPLYHGEDIEIPDLKKMDLVDIDNFLENLRENRDLLEAQYLQEQEAINRAEEEKRKKEKEEEDERLLQLYKERFEQKLRNG